MRSDNLSLVDVPLTRGFVTRISACDFDKVKEFKWQAAFAGDKPYARHAMSDGKTMYMHRLIMGLGAGRKPVVDHINGDTLDNSRANLRVCTQSVNLQNRHSSKPSASPYRGVFACCGKWMARLCLNHESFYLGLFRCQEDAALAYDAAAKRLIGRGAYLNFRESSNETAA